MEKLQPRKKQEGREKRKEKKEETRSMNTCRIKGKKREEKEHKIQIVPLRRDEDRLTIL